MPQRKHNSPGVRRLEERRRRRERRVGGPASVEVAASDGVGTGLGAPVASLHDGLDDGFPVLLYDLEVERPVRVLSAEFVALLGERLRDALVR